MAAPSSTGLSFIPRVSALSERVLRVLGCNPGQMTLQGTNTYIVGSGNKRLLIDTGDGTKPEYVENLRKTLEEHKARLGQVVLTHWHLDHVGGVAVVRDGVDSGLTFHKHERTDGKEDTLPEGVPFSKIADGQVFEVEGATLQAIYTPGHAADHVVLHLKEEDAIFSGDCILGEGTAVFEDLHDYMLSLKKILGLKPKVIYPAHGAVVNDPIDRINYYISHRMLRENQILETLAGDTGRSFSAMDIVKIVYKETPENLHMAAAFNVSHHLSKLEKEGKVIKEKSSRDEDVYHLGANASL